MKRTATALLATVVLAASGAAAHAQDILNNVVRSSTNSKPTFAVFDVRPASTSLDALQDAVSSAFKKHYDGIKTTQQMAPYPLPSGAPRMTFQQASSAAGTISVPDCAGASAIITSSDGTLAKYGEISVLQGCVFPYRDGYRVNVYALFVQKSGGANINVLGAMLGRAVTNAIGIGDSSKFVGETIDDIETRLKAITPQVALVELQPSRPDKVVAADPAPPAVPGQIAASASTAPPAGLPPQLAAVQAQLAAAIRQQQVANGLQPSAPAGDASTGAVLQARKDLSSMGLTYYSQEQFVEAARRGDRMACELFLRAGSVKANVPDKSGVTALQAAQSADLQTFLRSSAQ